MEYRIPIPAKRRITLTIEEMGGRTVTLRPISGRVLKLYEACQANPTEPSRLLDVLEVLLGGEGGLTREDIEGLSLDALEQIMIVARMPIEDLEAAAKKDAATGAA